MNTNDTIDAIPSDHNETSKTKAATAATSIVDNVFDVGEAWASYGLKIAELAVGTSARTLDNVAKALGTLAEHLQKEGAITR